jgi:hypothetical protein
MRFLLYFKLKLPGAPLLAGFRGASIHLWINCGWQKSPLYWIDKKPLFQGRSIGKRLWCVKIKQNALLGDFP